MLVIAVACGPSPRSRSPGRSSAAAMARLVPDGGQGRVTVTDAVATPDQLWLVTAPHSTGATLWRLGADGALVERARLPGNTVRLLRRPAGLAAIRGGYYTSITWLDGAGAVGPETALALDGYSRLPAVALPGGGVAVVGLRTGAPDDAIACVLVEVDERGQEVRRTTLWQFEPAGNLAGLLGRHIADACGDTNIVPLDDDLVLSAPVGAPAHLFGLDTGPGSFVPSLVVRLDRDRRVRWHRVLQIEGAYVMAPALAAGDATVMVAAGVQRDAGPDLPVTLGPSPTTLPAASAPGGAVLVLGLDPATGASRWARIMATDGARIDPKRGVAAIAGGGLGLIVRVLVGGRLDAGDVAGGGAQITTFDEASGEIALRRTLHGEPCPPPRAWSASWADDVGGGFAAGLAIERVLVDASGAVIVAGGVRGVLHSDGRELLRTPCDEDAAARPPSPHLGDPGLLAMPPPPWRPPPPPSYGFVATLRPARP